MQQSLTDDDDGWVAEDIDFEADKGDVIGQILFISCPLRLTLPLGILCLHRIGQ
jgi:hypothetical protein